jgi:GNAT superfamily N-acetyltransferase
MTSPGTGTAPGGLAAVQVAPSSPRVGAAPDAGRLVRARRAVTADREPVSQMFERCTLDTRYRRFHGPVKAIPDRYLTEALAGDPFHYALVACPVPDPGAVPEPVSALDPAASGSCAVPDPGTWADGIVALASCRTVDEGAAELGLLIEDAWQRHGLGSRLLRDLVTHARQTGLRVLQAQLLAEQAWITDLLRPYGPCRLRSTWAGVLNVTVQIAPSTQKSLAH